MEHQLKRWLVGLDFSETDQRLLDYVAFLAGLLKPETVYFIHSPENLDMPEEVKAAVYQTDQPLDEYFKARMHQEVGDRFEGLTDEIKLEYKVTEGSPLQEILRWSKIKDVDLILVGKKHESGGSGVLPKRLARQAACSIGFVPEDAKPNLKRIMVGVDFSDASKNAMERALSFAKSYGAAEILAHNVYDVPQGYGSAGKSFEEFAEIMKSHADTRYRIFMQTIRTDNVTVSPVFSLSEKKAPARTLCKAATEHQADLLLITSRGRNRFSAMLLGSFAERMVVEDISVPMMILKNKNENMSVLDALLRV